MQIVYDLGTDNCLKDAINGAYFNVYRSQFEECLFGAF